MTVNSKCDLDAGPKLLDCKLVQDNAALNICVKLLQNLSTNEGAKAIRKFFLKNSNCDLDLGPKMLQYVRYCHTSYLCDVISK